MDIVRTWVLAPLLVVLGVCVLGPRSARAQELPSGPISLAGGRVVLGADLSVSMSTETDKAADPTHAGWFNYTDYEHSTMRMARIGVTADVRLADRMSFLTELRSENGDAPRPYALFVRVKLFKSRAVDIQAGRIPPTFGAFARRNYSSDTPLIGYPLAYLYTLAPPKLQRVMILLIVLPMSWLALYAFTDKGDRQVALRVHRLQTQELGHHRIGDVVGDGRAQEDDALLEQLGVRVNPPDAVRRTLLPLRDVVVHEDSRF